MEIKKFDIVKYKNGACKKLADVVVREEPLDIVINGKKEYFCMRMPGMDYELALGLLYNEGIINSLSDIEKFDICGDRIEFKINDRSDITHDKKRIYSSSGSISSDELISPQKQSSGTFSIEELFRLQNNFFEVQKIFDKTGGTHASAFYASNGELIAFAEDVGRHNALDKCMGIAIKSGNSAHITLVMLSSRISFEMIKKSFRTGAVIVAGVSAPTSAAIQTAKDLNITLIGFLREGRFNVYSHHERVVGVRP